MTNGKSDPSRIAAQIDDNLRRIFAEDVEDELPDRLRHLVDQLDALPSAPDDDGEDDDEGSSGDGGASGEGSDESSDGSVRGAAAACALRRMASRSHRKGTALTIAKDAR